MKKTFKLLSLLLCLLMILSVFSACLGSDKDVQNTENEDLGAASTDNEGVDGADLYDANGYLKDDLPETYNFDSDFVIYSWDGQKHWEWEEDDTKAVGDTVEEALWFREKNVETRFGITMTRAYQKGEWSDMGTFINSLAVSVLANDRLYDMVSQYTAAAGLGTAAGLYSDLVGNQYINLEKPWWPEAMIESASIGDELYFATGDITPTLFRHSHCMFVNLDMWNQYELSNLVDGKTIFQVVEDYEWTLETMITLSTGKVAMDDSVSDSFRKYGISFYNSAIIDAFLYGGGFTCIENVDGIMRLSESLGGSDLVDWTEEVSLLFNNGYPDIICGGENTTTTDWFASSRAIFYGGQATHSVDFSAANVNFTMLPMPMASSAQKQYRTCATMYVSMFSIPVDADPTMSGVIFEALGSEAYRTVSDVVYENFFKYRHNAHSEDTAKMFDLVFDTVVFDPARSFSQEFGLFGAFRNTILEKGSWTDTYASYKEAWSDRIEDLYLKLG